MRLFPTILVVALSGAACSRDDGEAARRRSPLLHSPTPRAVTIDVARVAGDAGELARALGARRRDTAARLGAHRFKGSASLKVSENGTLVDSLAEETTIDGGDAGDFHALYTNSRDYGREVFYRPGDGGTLWIRPRYGKFHKRPPTAPDEPDNVADEIYGTLAADFELVAGFAAGKDAGAVDVAGRPARKIQLALAPSAHPAARHTGEQAWRDSITVEALDGEVTLDAQTGSLLAGRLTARLSFQRAGRSFTMELAAQHAISDVATQIAISPPGDADSVTTPLRATDFEDRDELLSGIAQPARKAPVPGGEGGK